MGACLASEGRRGGRPVQILLPGVVAVTDYWTRATDAIRLQGKLAQGQSAYGLGGTIIAPEASTTAGLVCLAARSKSIFPLTSQSIASG